jgi:hypothetical protein
MAALHPIGMKRIRFAALTIKGSQPGQVKGQHQQQHRRLAGRRVVRGVP